MTMTYVKAASPQSIFGEMVKRVPKHIQIFHSDLYHDAIGLLKRVEAPDSMGYIELKKPFLWLVGLTGTNLYWLDWADKYGGIEGLKSIVQEYPNIYFYDGYTLSAEPISIDEACGAIRAFKQM